MMKIKKCSAYHHYNMYFGNKKRRSVLSGEQDHIHGMVEENVCELSRYCDKHRIPLAQRLFSLCFDSITIKSGLQWDANGNMIGCDLEMCNNDVVTKMFKDMVRRPSFACNHITEVIFCVLIC